MPQVLWSLTAERDLSRTPAPVREGLEELPSEVVLYWFTLCFYGYRQAAGRAALRTLFTHEEPEEMIEARSATRKRKRAQEPELNLFSLSDGEQCSRIRDVLASYTRIYAENGQPTRETSATKQETALKQR